MSRLIIGFLLLFLLLAGCSQQETPAPVPEKKATKSELEVVVPDKVKSGWSAVEITVRDQKDDSSVVYTVMIGSSFTIPGSSLKVSVKSFLPNFIMSGGKITSRGRGAGNPAVQVVVTDNDKPLYDGWLFSLYPKSHGFVHPRYNLSLSGFVAAPQTKTATAEKG